MVIPIRHPMVSFQREDSRSAGHLAAGRLGRREATFTAKQTPKGLQATDVRILPAEEPDRSLAGFGRCDSFGVSGRNHLVSGFGFRVEG